MGRPGGVAQPDDIIVTLNCRCHESPVLVLESLADTWRCSRGHTGTKGDRFRLVPQKLTLDEYVPEHLEQV